MATMTVSLPDPLKDWIEERVAAGDFASASDYVRELVRRDRQRQDVEGKGVPMTDDELRALIADALESGPSKRSVGDIRSEGRRIALARGWLDADL